MRAGLAIYAAAAYLFLYGPLGVLFVFSLNSSRFARWEHFSLHWYRSLAVSTELREAAANSLFIALISSVAATAAGTLAASALWKRRSAFLRYALYLSLLTPEIVTGISLLVFFQWVFRYLHWQLGLHTVILAHVSFSLVFAVVVVLARLRTFDETLEQAALDLGATEWQAFRRVTLPLLTPAIVAAALLSFTVSFDDYVITSMVAGVDSETLPMVVYAMARRGVSPTVNAISSVITIGLGLLILLAQRAMRDA